MNENYMVIKDGYFYRPDSKGYTALKRDAGRFTETEADEIVAKAPEAWKLTVDEALDYTSNADKQQVIDLLIDERDELRELVKYYRSQLNERN